MSENEFETENMASIEPSSKEQFLRLVPENSRDALAKLQTASEMTTNSLMIALRQTKPQDWVLMGKAYYLEASGVERIRGVLGLYIRNKSYKKEELPNGHYAYIFTATGGSTFLDGLYGKEITIEMNGARASDDKLFSKQAVTYPMDVLKSAESNFLVRLAKALFGFGNFTEEDLKKMGVNTSKITTVTYEKGAEGGVKQGCISEPQAKRLYALCSSNNIPAESIKKYLKEKYNVDSSKDIQRTDYEKICNWFQAGGVEQPKEGQ
jgi:hypothetical protein